MVGVFIFYGILIFIGTFIYSLVYNHVDIMQGIGFKGVKQHNVFYFDCEIDKLTAQIVEKESIISFLRAQGQEDEIALHVQDIINISKKRSLLWKQKIFIGV